MEPMERIASLRMNKIKLINKNNLIFYGMVFNSKNKENWM